MIQWLIRLFTKGHIYTEDLSINAKNYQCNRILIKTNLYCVATIAAQCIIDNKTDPEENSTLVLSNCRPPVGESPISGWPTNTSWWLRVLARTAGLHKTCSPILPKSPFKNKQTTVGHSLLLQWLKIIFFYKWHFPFVYAWKNHIQNAWIVQIYLKIPEESVSPKNKCLEVTEPSKPKQSDQWRHEIWRGDWALFPPILNPYASLKESSSIRFNRTELLRCSASVLNQHLADQKGSLWTICLHCLMTVA